MRDRLDRAFFHRSFKSCPTSPSPLQILLLDPRKLQTCAFMIWVVKQYISKHHFRLGVTASLAWHRLAAYHLLAGKRLNQHGRGGFREAFIVRGRNIVITRTSLCKYRSTAYAAFDRNQKEILRCATLRITCQPKRKFHGPRAHHFAWKCAKTLWSAVACYRFGSGQLAGREAVYRTLGSGAASDLAG